MEEFIISYDSQTNVGFLLNSNASTSSSWQRISSTSLNLEINSIIDPNRIRLPWYQLLSILREYIPQQKQLRFKFVTDESSKPFVQRFIQEQRATAAPRSTIVETIPESEIEQRIRALEFTVRDLR